MSEFVLDAEVREVTGKHAKYARGRGFVPGVYYSRGEACINIQVEKPRLDPLVFTSETHVIDLHLKDGSSHKCILRDVQYDPVSDLPIHFDLQGLRENEKLTIEIPVVLTGGIPKGVRDGVDSAIVGVMPPTVVKEEETAVPVAEEAAKEPEVVGKGKKAEEGEGAEPAKAEAKPAAGKEEKKEKK